MYMNNKQIIKKGIINSLGVLVYIFLLSSFMSQANNWFGTTDQDIVTPVAVLMLFIFSALVTGGLVLGNPLALYLDGKKKEAIKLLFITGASLFVLMVIVFVVLLLLK